MFPPVIRRAVFWGFLLFPGVCLLPISCAEDRPAGAPSQFRVTTYNVQNWRTTDRTVGGRYYRSAPKPDSEKQAVVSILKTINPDILAVQEMGTLSDFKDFQGHLVRVGLKYPYTEYITGFSSHGRIALLSRLPIARGRSHANLQFKLSGQTLGVLRGFIDVDIDITPQMRVRILVAHLKSPRDDENGLDAEKIRLKEAALLRDIIEEQLGREPESHLLVLGDFNDTPRSKTLKTITGAKKDPVHLFDLWIRDRQGDLWTHYYAGQKTYSPLDYIVVSQSLFIRWIRDSSQSFIYREPDGAPEGLRWSSASDHRPVTATFSVIPLPAARDVGEREPED